MKYTVLITTSGVGDRLGELTKFTNKALVRIGAKPAISHIIESYPKDTQFVVTLGYFGEQVQDFLSLAYPDLNFKYVNVNPFVGPGSSLGETMLQAKPFLKGAFVYHACDTLVTEPVPIPKQNWIGVFRGSNTSHYASWTIQEGQLRFHDKGAIGPNLIHIGLVGINDFKKFWKTLEDLKRENPDDGSLNDCKVLERMIRAGESMSMVEFPSWRDIGDVSSLRRAQDHEVLFKPGEAVFIFEKFVIKFFADAVVAANRAKRAKLLKGFVPKLQGARGNFYRYEYVEGRSYPDVIEVKDFERYLTWVQEKFWGKPLKSIETKEFMRACKKFYEGKTKDRIEKLFALTGLQDSEHIINGERVPKISDMLAQIDFDWLSDGIQSRFHGDFVLDNVVKTKNGYSLVDWRQDFGGFLDVGDRYYDLAKLNHNLTVNHHVVSEDLFTVNVQEKTVRVDIMRPGVLVDCEEIFRKFLNENKYDLGKIQILTALIWFSSAPLHHYPYNLFLYYFGKLNLWRAIQKQR